MKKTLAILCAATLLVPSTALAQHATLKTTLGQHFLIGAALNTNVPDGNDPRSAELVKQQFNSIVAENCMKGERIHPEESVYNWTDADRLVQFGTENGMAVIGHCLIWHSQAPHWMFTDKDGKTVSKSVLIDRMYHLSLIHI